MTSITCTTFLPAQTGYPTVWLPGNIVTIFRAVHDPFRKPITQTVILTRQTLASFVHEYKSGHAPVTALPVPSNVLGSNEVMS